MGDTHPSHPRMPQPPSLHCEPCCRGVPPCLVSFARRGNTIQQDASSSSTGERQAGPMPQCSLYLCHLQWPDRNAVAILVHLPHSPLLIPGSPRSPIPVLPNKKLIPQRCPSHPAFPPHCLQPVTQVLLHRQLRQSCFSSKYPCGCFKHLGTNQTQCKFSFLTPYSLK